MKKILKIIFLAWIAISAVLIVVGVFLHKPLPKAQVNPKADALAHKMLNALDYQKYTQTRFLEWSFRGNHFYKWDKFENKVNVSWEGNEVLLYTNAFEKTQVITKAAEDVTEHDLKQQALAYFNNDSFWLVAPYKVFDPAVERGIVMEDGKEALLVTYKSGGSTPGDSYLWYLNDNGFPYAYRMWVKIIPVGGLKASWEDWQMTNAGIKLPKTHQAIFGSIDMGQVKAYN